MKCTSLLLIILSIAMITNCNKWADSFLNYKNMKIRLIIHESVNPRSIPKLIESVDKSALVKNPIALLENYKGIIREDDIIVVSKKLLMWFSLTTKSKGRVVRSGGGLLAGMWEILVDDKRNAKLKNMEEKTNYSSNLLLAGSEPGIKLFGADIFGGYSGNKVVWGIEYATDVRSSKRTGQDILSLDRGAYSPDEGVFIVTKGVIGNSNQAPGIDNENDTDPRKGIKGITHYTLTYRIPANRLEFITECELEVKENNFGPISNAYLAMYLPGYSPKNMVYASNPELIPLSKQMKLENVDINKWFRNSAVKKTFFYDVKYSKHTSRKFSAQTSPGNGRILCTGSPKDKIGFFCGYPNNDYIPKETYEEYTLELSDNQKLQKSGNGKFHTLNYKLLTTPGKTITLTQGQKLLMIMRYKIINATLPLPGKDEKMPENGSEVKVK